MKKLINFKTTNLIDEVQDFADKYFEGNFSQAVRKLQVKSLTKS